jgi:site-specific DNA recombinase
LAAEGQLNAVLVYAPDRLSRRYAYTGGRPLHRSDKASRRCLRRDLARLQKSTERLLTAYQEDLLSLDELRHRMPELRQREYATRAELQSIAEQTTDRAAYLRLAETLAASLARLRSAAETLDIIERQRVVRPAGQGDPGQ